MLTDLGGFGATGVAKQLEGKAVGKPEWMEADGEFEVKAAGLYQFDATASGALEIAVDGKPAFAQPKEWIARQGYALVSLDAGWHALRLRFLPKDAWDFSVLLAGDQVAAPISGAMLRHASSAK